MSAETGSASRRTGKQKDLVTILEHGIRSIEELGLAPVDHHADIRQRDGRSRAKQSLST